MQLDGTIALSEENCKSPNLAGKLDYKDLATLGLEVKRGYDLDEASREKWKKRSEAALNLALQLQEVKSFPWPGASNVKFPLVTVASVQWHSRAYPVLTKGPNLVKMAVFGNDPQGQLQQVADRVGKHMSWQLLQESCQWKQEADRALLQVPIVGCAFKKVYRDPNSARNVSELVPAADLCVSYWTKSLDTCPRATHIIPLHRNEVYTRVEAGLFRDCRDEGWYTGEPSPASRRPESSKADRRTGQTPPSSPDITTPFIFLEQHVRCDLDGDGYDEPYIITVERNSGYVVRIVTAFDWDAIVWSSRNRVLRIPAEQYFVKIPFIPQPDGGFYDMGFGTLLGPLNESVDSLINQLIDAGTIANTSGGFLGRGVKIRGGEQNLRQFGWVRVDSMGDDLRKNIVETPVRDPSNVSLALLQLLVDYTNRISGSTDIMVGESPGQNTPAETSRMMAEQGAKINSAIYERVWEAMRQEFRLLFLLNRRFTPLTVLTYGERSGSISRDDYMLPEEAVRPVADPHLSSDTLRMQQASMVKQSATGTPGYDKDAVERYWLHSLRVEEADRLFLGSDKVKPLTHPRVQIEQIKAQTKAASDKMRLQEKILEIQSDREKTAAEVELIKAQIAQILSEVGEAQAASQVKAFEARLGALKAIDESQRGYLDLLMKGMQGSGDGTQQGGVPGMVAPPSNAGGAGMAPAAGGGGLG